MQTLDRFKRAVTYIRGPNSSCVVNYGLNIRLKCAQQRLFLASPASAGERIQKPHLLSTGFDHVHDVRVEAEVRIKADAEDTRRFVEGNRLIID